jgi:hypothetical protein
VLPTSPIKGGAIAEVEGKIAADSTKDSSPRDISRPSLALLNLFRGDTYKLPSGQAIAKALLDRGCKFEPIDSQYLVTRKTGDKDKTFKFVKIHPDLQEDTPLWFYILAEAQRSVLDELKKLNPPVDPEQDFDESKLLDPKVAQTSLGWVGGRIVAEVFYGLMDSDTDSYLNQPTPNNGKAFQPIWANDPTINDSSIIFANLLKFAGQPITKTPKAPPAAGC